MAFSATIEIHDRATPLLEATQAKIRPEAVNRVAGRAGQNFVRDHFTNLNRTRPNKLGGKRTNFYTQAARGTHFKSDASSAVVSVNQVGIRQRIEGGVILPKNGKFLTIPARAEAYGRKASDFTNLKVAFNARGPFALVEADATRVRKTKAGFKSGGEVGGGVMFWLVPKVVQQPDPSVMPDLRRMADHIIDDLAQYIRLKEARTHGERPSEGGAA